MVRRGRVVADTTVRPEIIGIDLERVTVAHIRGTDGTDI